MDYKVFHTENLTLRPTSVEDAEFIFELVNTPKWLRYVGDRKIRSVDDAKAYIELKMLPQLEKLGFANYTLIRKTDNAKVGTCGLYDREGTEGIDLGYALLPAYEKMGYATEAARKLMEAAQNEFGIDKLSAYTTKDHMASRKLLEKLDFTIKGSLTFPDEDEELLHYHINLKTKK